MKLKKITLAVAGALAAGAAGQASAYLNLSTLNSGNTTDIYLSGATAQENGILALMRRVCVVDTLDVFTGSNQFMYVCQVNTNQISGLSKPNVAVRKMGQGGSGNGVQPVADNTNLQFMSLSAFQANTSLCGAATVQASSAPQLGTSDALGLPAYQTRTCSVGTTAAPSALITAVAPPDAGFSDVEPALFGATSAQLSRIDPPKSVNSIVFGIPVTLKAYRALQTAQGLTGDDTEANMPSLTKAQIASIFNGNISTWSQLVGTNGVALAPANNNIYVVRRVNSSGTQTFTGVHFLNTPCAAGVLPFVTANDTAADTSGGTCGNADPTKTVWQGSGSGDVRNCLVNHDTNSRWGIGLLSLESSQPTATSNTWRYVKIDGYAPSQLNVFNGKYPYWAEQTVQYRTSGANVLAGDKLTFVDAFISQLGDPAVVSQLNAAFTHPWGKSGLFSLSTVYAPTDPSALAAVPAFGLPAGPRALNAADILINPVNPATRSPNGPPNNCQSPVVFNPTTVGK
jgi:hypothetical protein